MAVARMRTARSRSRLQPVGAAERRLELLESLLMAADPEECARRALAWLQRRAGIRRGVCLATRTSEGPRLVPLASIGVPAVRLRGFSVDLEARDHPLGSGAVFLPARRARVERSCPGRPARRRTDPGHSAARPGAERAAGRALAVDAAVAGRRRRRPVAGTRARPSPGRAHRGHGSRGNRAAAAARAHAALQHHQHRHRPDPPHRRRRAHHDRQRAGRGPAGDRRGPERGPAPRGRAEQHAVLGGAVAPRAGRRGGAAPRGAAGRSGRRLRPAVRGAEHGDQRRARGHRHRLGAAQRHRPAAGHRRDRGELPPAPPDRVGGPGRARSAGARHRLGGRSRSS